MLTRSNCCCSLELGPRLAGFARSITQGVNGQQKHITMQLENKGKLLIKLLVNSAFRNDYVIYMLPSLMFTLFVFIANYFGKKEGEITFKSDNDCGCSNSSLPISGNCFSRIPSPIFYSSGLNSVNLRIHARWLIIQFISALSTPANSIG